MQYNEIPPVDRRCGSYQTGHQVHWIQAKKSETTFHHAERDALTHLVGPLEHVERVSTTSVAIELDQPLVADPEVMRDLVEHDVPDLAA